MNERGERREEEEDEEERGVNDEGKQWREFSNSDNSDDASYCPQNHWQLKYDTLQVGIEGEQRQGRTRGGTFRFSLAIWILRVMECPVSVSLSSLHTRTECANVAKSC